MSRNLPTQSYTLPQFCQTAKELLQANDVTAFVRFVINGIHMDHQAVVDPIRDRLTPQHVITGLRDYDSLLGIDRNIVVAEALTLYTLPPKIHTLKKNVYLRFSVDTEEVSLDVPLHHIPNICIGKWSVHSLVRVLIPGLYTEDRNDSALTSREQTTFCEKGLYPAVRQLMGARGHDWPSSYTDELFRARDGQGRLLSQTKIVDRHVVAHLARTIRAQLVANGVAWGNTVYILHQLQGVKNELPHSVTREAAEHAYEQFLIANKLSRNRLLTGDWYIDVGLELTSSRGECLAWRTDGHADLVENFLQIDERHAVRITTLGSSKYSRDMTSHLPALSGCRIIPGAQAEGPFHARYVQLYQTCKSHTARKDGGNHAKYITTAQILKGTSHTYLDNLYHLYQKASIDHSSLARAEVRVPIAHATAPFMRLSNPVLKGALVSFPKVVWWSLRAYRALAFTYIIEAQLQGPIDHRLKEPALLLTAAAPWFLNSLHCTPDTRASSRDLLNAILPHVRRNGVDPNILPFVASTRPRNQTTDEDETDGEPDLATDHDSDSDSDSSELNFRVIGYGHNTVPCIPYGMVFLRPLRLGGKYTVPRFDHKDRHFINDSTFKVIFGVHQEGVTFQLLAKSLIPVDSRRLSNRIHSTTRFVNHGQHDSQVAFDLERHGYALQPLEQDPGSDMEEEDPNVIESLNSLDAQITVIWRQFLADITSKCPNRSTKRKNTDGYCKLTKEQRDLVNEDTYRNQNLADYFNDCQWVIGTEANFDLVFKHLFPPEAPTIPEAKKGKLQNYTAMTYFKSWIPFVKRCSRRTKNAVLRQLRRRFDTLFWMPYASSERVWWTKVDDVAPHKKPRFRKSSGENPSDPAPRVIVRSKPVWVE